MTEAVTKPEAPANDAVVFDCELEDPPAKVWRAVAEPAIRSEWLGEPETGPSEVRLADPPERLDLAWPTPEGESLVRFEIFPSEEGGSRLTITHHAPRTAQVVPFPARSRLTMSAAGWRVAA